MGAYSLRWQDSPHYEAPPAVKVGFWRPGINFLAHSNARGNQTGKNMMAWLCFQGTGASSSQSTKSPGKCENAPHHCNNNSLSSTQLQLLQGMQDPNMLLGGPMILQWGTHTHILDTERIFHARRNSQIIWGCEDWMPGVKETWKPHSDQEWVNVEQSDRLRDSQHPHFYSPKQGSKDLHSSFQRSTTFCSCQNILILKQRRLTCRWHPLTAFKLAGLWVLA